MSKEETAFKQHEAFICYEDKLAAIFDVSSSDKDEMIFMHSFGAGVLVRDFWNYYYVINDTTIEEIMNMDQVKDDLLLVGNNLLVNMRYIDTINSKFIQIAEHIFPLDQRIKHNIDNYKKLVYETKEHYDKICDEPEDDDRFGSGYGMSDTYNNFFD